MILIKLIYKTVAKDV